MAAPKLLVIDDNADEGHMLATAFAGHYEVTTAADGLDGYALACIHCPSAIVLDLMMPLVDGWTVLRKLRTNPTTKDIPVVIVTALELDAVSAPARALGVSSILRKPSAMAELRTVVQREIARKAVTNRE